MTSQTYANANSIAELASEQALVGQRCRALSRPVVINADLARDRDKYMARFAMDEPNRRWFSWARRSHRTQQPTSSIIATGPTQATPVTPAAQPVHTALPPESTQQAHVAPPQEHRQTNDQSVTVDRLPDLRKVSIADINPITGDRYDGTGFGQQQPVSETDQDGLGTCQRPTTQRLLWLG